MSYLSIELDRNDVVRLFARLGRAGAAKTLHPSLTRGLERLRRDLADYPPPAPKRQPAKSRKQRIKQIMLAKEGKIPYRRTGNLGRSWAVEVKEDSDGIEGVVGNAVVSPEGVRYGPLVQGEDTQAPYHRGTWQTDEMVFNRQKDGIIRDLIDAVEDALK